MPNIDGKEFKWMSPPKSWSESEGVVKLKTDPETDFWRKTHYGFISDNGHFLYSEQEGDFEISLKFSGKYAELYDQAGLMIFLDHENWIKAGIEYVEGIQNASAVVTRDCSDWSVAALKGMPASFFIKAKRGRDYVEISYSLDGEKYSLLRQAYFPPSPSVQVGIMAASPKGSGFDVTFDSLQIKAIKVE